MSHSDSVQSGVRWMGTAVWGSREVQMVFVEEGVKAVCAGLGSAPQCCRKHSSCDCCSC